MEFNRYRIKPDGSYQFYTFKKDDEFNQDVWLVDDGRFELKSDGTHYAFYNEDGTPDLTKETIADKKTTLEDATKTYEKEVAKLTEGVPPSEVATWTKQELEARSYIADNNAPTPLIESLATARGVDKVYLINKIIEKADAYASAIGTLTGIRQKVEDEQSI